jgi:hypothetical protein
MRWAGHVGRMRDTRSIFKKLVGNSQRKLGRIWVTVLKWIGTKMDEVDWIDLAQERIQWWCLVYTAMNRAPTCGE